MRCRPCNPRRTAHGGRAQPTPEPNDHRTTNRHTNGKATTGEAARGPKRAGGTPAGRTSGGKRTRPQAKPRTGRTRTNDDTTRSHAGVGASEARPGTTLKHWRPARQGRPAAGRNDKCKRKPAEKRREHGCSKLCFLGSALISPLHPTNFSGCFSVVNAGDCIYKGLRCVFDAINIAAD